PRPLTRRHAGSWRTALAACTRRTFSAQGFSGNTGTSGGIHRLPVFLVFRDAGTALPCSHIRSRLLSEPAFPLGGRALVHGTTSAYRYYSLRETHTGPRNGR